MYILFFVEYTYARSPLFYCNHKESPPPYLVELNQDGKFKTIPNQSASLSSGGPNINLNGLASGENDEN